MKKGFSLLIITLLFLACGIQNDPPENLIKEDKYINLMIELQLLRSYQKQSDADSASIDSLLQAIFKKYGVTKKQFRQSRQYYQNQLKKQPDRIDKAIERLRKDQMHKLNTANDDSTASN